MAQKGFGLIVRKKAAPPAQNVLKSKGALSAFGGDSDSDDDAGEQYVGRAGVNYQMGKEAAKNKGAAKTQQAWRKAVEEDATVYQYDEIYDDMQTTRLQIGAEASKAKKKQQSKYLAQMQRTVEKKKLLDALRDERIAQREREKEGAEFQDKESFVTSGMQEHLEKLQSLKEEEARKDAVEAANDVTKSKGGLTSITRNLMYHDMGGKKSSEEEASGPAAAAKKADDQSPASLQETARRDRDRGKRKSRPQMVAPKKKKEPEVDPAKYARKTTEEGVSDAKARFLARKAERAARALPKMED